MNSEKAVERSIRWHRKIPYRAREIQRQGARILRNEAYFSVGRMPAPAKVGER